MLLAFSTLSFAQCQSYRIKAFSKKDGFSSSQVRKVVKDHNGFVWMSTQEGLTRFDGHTFFTFRHHENDSLSIANDRCNAILIDKYNRLWVNTDDGISLFDSKNQSFTNYFPDSRVLKTLGNSLGSMYETADDKIWICGQFEILVFDMKTKTFTVSGWYQFAKNAGIIKQELRNNISSSITMKSEHELWLLTVYGLFSVDLNTNRFQYYPNDNLETPDYFAYYIDYQDNNYLYISTYDNHFFTFDLRTFKWQHHFTDAEGKAIPKYIHHIRLLNKDTLMFLGNSALSYYSISNGRISKFKEPNFTNENILTYELIDQMIYTVKQNENIEILKPNKLWFSKQAITLLKGENIARYLHSKHGSIIYLGSWDSKNIYSHDYIKKTTKKLLDHAGKPIQGTLQNYISIDKGFGYISTDNDVFLIDETKIKATKFNKENIDNQLFKFRNFVEDKYGNYYVRERDNGLFALNKETRTLKLMTPKSNVNEYGALTYDWLRDQFFMSEDHKGVKVFSNKGILIKHYPLYVEPVHRMAYTNDLTYDSNGIITMTEPGKGLILLDTKTDKFKRVGTADGLPSSEVRYIEKSQNGKYWISSDDGLIYFDYHTGQFTLLPYEGENLFFYDRLFQTNEGKLASVSNNGVLIIKNKYESNHNIRQGKFYIKQVKILGKNKAISDQYILSHDENDIEIQIGFQDFELLEIPIIEYRINDQTWRPMDQQLTFNFLNLQPDDYFIEIREKYNPNNKINFKISITKPWWNSTLFYLAMIIASIILFTLWYRYKMKNLQEKETEKREIQVKISKLEMNALKAQMNPHFIFNCLNSINKFILTNDTDKASDYLTKFSRLIRSVLDISKSETISLESELNHLNLYIAMEAMRFTDSFEYKLDVDPSINLQDYTIPPLLLQPFVENAIWHGLMHKEHGLKKLDVKVFKKQLDEILITIMDNGVGRKKAAELKSKELKNHKSHGIQITQDRLSLITKDSNKINMIETEDLYKNSLPIGTKIIITLHI